MPEIKSESLSVLPGCENLAALKHFDPRVFQFLGKNEQEVCNFILMLALIYNDFKDLSWAYVHMDKCKPPTTPQATPHIGQYAGMNLHLTKLFHSLLFEFTKLIKNSSDVLNHQLFAKILQQIHKENKKNWNRLVAFAKGEADKNDAELYEISLLIRNNLAFHYYQPKFLSSGYNYFFSKKDAPIRQSAFISYGTTLEATRFYFADAAVQGCFEQNISKEKAGRLNLTLKDISGQINEALHNIITTFIQQRFFQLQKEFPNEKDKFGFFPSTGEFK